MGRVSFQVVDRMLHCGDSLFVMDQQANHWSVFSVAGKFKRTFSMTTIRIESNGGPRPASGGGDNPYKIQCNGTGQFVGQGWENSAEARPGVFRTLAPFWLSHGDGTIAAGLGSFPGSERWGQSDPQGRLRGTAPLPLGREPSIAIGRERAYVGTADSFVVMVFGMDGRSLI